jgi:SnoaL-like domain
MTSIEEIADRLAVEDVLKHYSHCLDIREVHRIVDEVFAPEARVDYGYGEWRGDEVAKWIQRQFDKRWVKTAHMLTNFRVQLDGEEAHTTCYLLGPHWTSVEPPERPADITLLGVYSDTLRRYPNGWRITRRKFTPLGPSTMAFGELPDFMRPRAVG